MSTSDTVPQNRSKTGQNSQVSPPQRVCANCDAFFSPAELENHKLAYNLMFRVEPPSNIELYCPNCVEALSQAIAENGQPWEYPTDKELEASLDLSNFRDDYL